MSDREEERETFEQRMARLHAKEQALAAKVDRLDGEMREFRRDLVVFHAKRDRVHALMQQEAQEHAQQHAQQHPVADALNTFGSTQIVAAPAPIRQDGQLATPALNDQDDEPVAPASPPFKDGQPVVDDGESLFIPEQPRNHEQTNSQPNRLKRPLTFAEAEEYVTRKYAAIEAKRQAQSSAAESVTPEFEPDDAHADNRDPELEPESKPEGNRRLRKRVRFL